MTFGSLFSGIGGFDLGLERAGMVPLWQCDNNPRCLSLLAAKWPDVRRYDDVRAVGAGADVPDLICGGFPCQDVSVAGRRAGLAGERSGLWSEFHRVLAELAPRWCVIENVPGLLSSNGGRDFASILRGLVELGYGVAWRVLDAQFAGLAQRRQRVFIVGSLGSGRAAQVLFEPESVRWNPAPRREARTDVAYTLGTGTADGRTERGDGSGNLQVADADLAYCVRHSDGHHGHSSPRGDGADDLVVADPILANIARTNDGAGNNPRPRNLLVDEVARSITASCFKRHDEDTDTLIAPVMGVRRLTPRECERLQGFPDDWTAGYSDSTRYQMCGNAVAVPESEAIGKRIVAVELAS